MERPEWIMDTDVGVDDATAILAAMHPPPSIPRPKMLAFSCVHGNVPLHQAVRNAKTLIAISRLHFPSPDSPPLVLAGAADQLMAHHPPYTRWDGHGSDGLGGVSLPPPETNPDAQLEPEAKGHGYANLVEGAQREFATEVEHAASCLARSVKERPGKITVVALGPLTNIALAIRISPTFPRDVAGVVVMGGNVLGRGNLSRAAEFNFGADPEAAHIVFSSFSSSSSPNVHPPKLLLVPWETCLLHSFPWSLKDRCTSNPQNQLGRFLGAIVDKYEKAVRKPEVQVTSTDGASDGAQGGYMDVLLKALETGGGGFCMADVYAVLAALHTPLVTATRDVHVDVELGGHVARGWCSVAWSRHHWPESGVNARVVVGMDQRGMEAVLDAVFAGTSTARV